jgi:hypothetical protein
MILDTIPPPITLEEALQLRQERERELFEIASNPAVNDPSEPSADGSTGTQHTPIPPFGSTKRGKPRNSSQRASPNANGSSNSNGHSHGESGSAPPAGSRRESGRKRVASARAAAAAGGGNSGDAVNGGPPSASTAPVEDSTDARSTGTWLPPPRSAPMFFTEGVFSR